MKKKPGKRPPMTEEEKAARAKLREEMRGTVSDKVLVALGNRGPAPSKYGPEFIAKLGKDLTKWSMNGEVYFIDDFCINYDPPLKRQHLIEFAEKDDAFSVTFENVKRRLISRLDSLALNKKIDGNYLSKIKPLIDKEYREWRLTEIKAEGLTDNQKNITVHINPHKGLEDASTPTIEVKP